MGSLFREIANAADLANKDAPTISTQPRRAVEKSHLAAEINEVRNRAAINNGSNLQNSPSIHSKGNSS